MPDTGPRTDARSERDALRAALLEIAAEIAALADRIEQTGHALAGGMVRHG